MDWNKVSGAIAFLRKENYGDGADGESIAVVCNAAEELRDLVRDLWWEVCDQTIGCRVCGNVSWGDTTDHRPDCPIGQLLGMTILPEQGEEQKK